MTETKRVAIVGAGSTGLAAARHAVLYGFEPVVFEKSVGIGGIWDYSDSHEERSVAFGTAMLDSKELSAFSDFPPPAKSSTFMNHTEVLEYLKAYADVHDLYPFIRLKHEVIGVRRVEDWDATGRWTVEYVDSLGSKSSETVDAVLLCTGMHSKPWRPLAWRHEDRFKGQVIHSFNYKNSSAYRDKVVVVVGGGNSAVHIASDLAGIAKRVHWSTRRGAWILNRVGKGGAPWDLSYNSRLYAIGRKLVPKALRNFMWKRELGDRLDHNAFGVEPNHGFTESHLTFGDHLADYLATGRIRVHPDLLSFQENGVEFADKTVVDDVDAVIICTGYEFDFSFVEDGKTLFVNWNDFHLYKLMFPPLLSKHNTLAVLGHVQPTGSLLPIAEMQARFFFHALSGQLKLPSAFDMKENLEFRRCDMSMNFVKSRRHAQIEDYVEYMDDLASRIGAKPSLFSLMKSDPVLAWHCLFGPALPYQYRLEGTHAWPGARNAVIAAKERLHARPAEVTRLHPGDRRPTPERSVHGHLARRWRNRARDDDNRAHNDDDDRRRSYHHNRYATYYHYLRNDQHYRYHHHNRYDANHHYYRHDDVDVHDDDHHNHHDDYDHRSTGIIRRGLACDAPMPTSQAGLTLCMQVTRQMAGDTSPVRAECPCTDIERQFWNTATNANPDDAGGAGQKAVGIQCPNPAMACVCREDGVCCTPGATAATTLSFYPFCDAAGVCHMYLVQEGDEASSLMCTDGMMFNLVDQFVNDVDITKQDLGPNSPYLQAESVCCGGCAPIMPANEVCTGPAMPGTG